MSKLRFEDLELPEEIYPQSYEDEPHPLKDEEWLGEVDQLAKDLEWKARDIQKQLQFLQEETRIINKFKYLKKLIFEYGGHKKDCEFFKIDVPRCGEEYSKCTCGWYELYWKLRRAQRGW